MTREEALEAIDVLKQARAVVLNNGEYDKAMGMAIEALKVELIRCKDCKHWHSNTEFCDIWSFQNIAQRTLSDDYCSRAERKEP